MTDEAGNWVCTWSSNDDLTGTVGMDFDIFLSRSTDDGATWSTSTALNSTAPSDSVSDLAPHLATDRLGKWIASWSSTNDLGSTIGSDSDILFTESIDAGVTWSTALALNANAATDAGSDVTPVVSADGLGTWVAVWASTDTLSATIGPDENIFYARSTDNGLS